MVYHNIKDYPKLTSIIPESLIRGIHIRSTLLSTSSPHQIDRCRDPSLGSPEANKRAGEPPTQPAHQFLEMDSKTCSPPPPARGGRPPPPPPKKKKKFIFLS